MRHSPVVAIVLGLLPGACLEREVVDGDAELPDIELCGPVLEWPETAGLWEGALIDRINEARVDGRMCGAEFVGPQSPLTYSGALTCAARLHAVDMATREFFDHVNPDDLGPADRVAATGVPFLEVYEAIAAGATPDQAADLWLDDDTQCSALLFDGFDRLGVGYSDQVDGVYDGYWVLLLGRSESSR